MLVFLSAYYATLYVLYVEYYFFCTLSWNICIFSSCCNCMLDLKGNDKMLFILKNAFLLLSFFLACSHLGIAILLPHHGNIISLQDWKTVDIDYYHDVRADGINIDTAKKYSHCTGSARNVNILRFKGYARLLRPSGMIKRWLKEQNVHGYFLFTVKEFNVEAVHGHVISVSNNDRRVLYRNHYTNMVTGLFLKYTGKIKKYHFITVKKNEISEIKATPNHRFYVINQRAFIPISKITTKDTLVNNKGESIKLLCSQGQIKHCGINYHHEQPVPVYNLEILNAHDYFAGKNHILVHNGYLEEQIKRLKQIPNGAAGNHDQATKELQKVKYAIDQGDGTSTRANKIECYASSWPPEGGPSMLEVNVIFYDDHWVIDKIQRNKSLSFYANDLIRHMYLKIQAYTSLDISRPESISIGPIRNAEIIKTMADSGSLSNLEQMQVFYTTPVGKMMDRILKDFNFQVIRCNNLSSASAHHLKSGGRPPEFSFTIKPA